MSEINWRGSADAVDRHAAACDVHGDDHSAAALNARPTNTRGSQRIASENLEWGRYNLHVRTPIHRADKYLTTDYQNLVS